MHFFGVLVLLISSARKIAVGSGAYLGLLLLHSSDHRRPQAIAISTPTRMTISRARAAVGKGWSPMNLPADVQFVPSTHTHHKLIRD